MKLSHFVYIPFHIVAGVYALIGFGITLLGVLLLLGGGAETAEVFGGVGMTFGIGLFAIVLGAINEIVVYGLKQKNQVAWIAGALIAGLYLLTFFLPFGVAMLYGLLHPTTRARFFLEEKSRKNSSSPKN